MVTLITPERVVIGGGIAAALDLLLPRIQRELAPSRDDHGPGTGPARIRRRSARGRRVRRGAFGVNGAHQLAGHLVLEDRIVDGAVTVAEGLIVAVVERPVAETAPYVAPGFVDVHVHGWGGHDAMGGRDSLDGMARALARRGVTSFLPTAVTAPLDALERFGDDVRGWISAGGAWDGAQALGFNLEGPFLAAARKGAHAAEHLRAPADVDESTLEGLADGLRLITIAPELPGALEMIRWCAARGISTSIGHSAASANVAREAYAAGARGTTHLFNAMSGLDHRAPGVALAALMEDDAFVELIADGVHVDPQLWALVARLKRSDRLVLVSDALSLAGIGDGRGQIGELEVEVAGARATLLGSDTLAGSVIALDDAVRNLVRHGSSLVSAVAAASRNPLELIGVNGGRIADGQPADLVELDSALQVGRVMVAGEWVVA
jgi:N-acetylglucosamine-6-phosphate deacetylase